MTIEARHGSYNDFFSGNYNALNKVVCPDTEEISVTLEGLPVTIKDKPFSLGGKITIDNQLRKNIRVRGAFYVDLQGDKLVLDMSLESGVAVFIRDDFQDLRVVNFRHTNKIDEGQ